MKKPMQSKSSKPVRPVADATLEQASGGINPQPLPPGRHGDI